MTRRKPAKVVYTMRTIVYLAFTSSPTNGQRRLIKVYKKSSYPEALLWLRTVAANHGVEMVETSGCDITMAYVRSESPAPPRGEPKMSCSVNYGQAWWLERHDAV